MNQEKIDFQIKIKNMFNCFDQLTVLDRLDWNKILILVTVLAILICMLFSKTVLFYEFFLRIDDI